MPRRGADLETGPRPRRFQKGSPSWPTSCGWRVRSAEMLQIDLEAAGIPYVVEGPDGPLYADFHALRHTYITQLAMSGMPVKQAQALARHSNVNLTIGRYAHASLVELGEAVQKLPPLTAPGAAAPQADPWAGIPQQALMTMALVGLALWDVLLSGCAGFVPPPVAPTQETTGDGPGRSGKKRRPSARRRPGPTA